jgi:Putative Flp pilus-assembly TadE/G-like
MIQMQTQNRIQIQGHREKGQTTIFVMLVLAIFMLGFIGFGVDMTNLFFRRQKAQGAADAACQACAMDLLAFYTGSPTPGMGFTPGTPFDCAANPTSAPCKYAALNGYNGSGLVANTESNSVAFTFPGSVPGVTPPDGSLAAFPFVTTTVTDQARVFFANLLNLSPGNRTRVVGASATCGLVQANAPVPIIVLNPICSHALQISGSGTTKIVGGPTKSIQVNSIYSGANGCAAATTNSGNGCASAGPTIDLTKGGPAYTGSSFGVFGVNANQIVVPNGFLQPVGFTGHWLVPSSPVPDPYALTPAPPKPGSVVANPDGVPVLYLQRGCPDHSGCTFYQRGLYDRSIVVKNKTAIFEPGIYYIEPTTALMALDNCGSSGTGCLPGNPPSGGQCAYDIDVDSNGVLRMSTDPGDGSGGVMFYLSGPNSGGRPFGSVFIGSNAGKAGGRTIDSFTTAGMNCDGSSPDPALGIPGSIDGNILLGQCTDGGNYRPYDGSGNIRGLLMFQDRRNYYTNGQPSMQGGGGLVLSGTLYFHNCKNSDSSGVACNAAPTPSDTIGPTHGYQSFFQLQGSPGGGTYVLGNITTDQFIIAGNGNISMQLDPNPVYHILKATLLQ